MRKIIAFSLAIAACAPASPAVAQVADAEVDSVAASGLSQFIAAWNSAAAGDVRGYDLYRDLYWPDADLVDPTGGVWNDQNGIVQMHVDLWNAPFKGSMVRGSVRKARRLSPTVMVADFDLELALFKPSSAGAREPAGAMNAHLKMVMQKRGAKWKVITSQNTFFGNPPPGPPRE